MAASACSLLRAHGHLTKKSYAERICSMEDVRKFVTTCYPTLNIDMYSTDQVVDAGNTSGASQWAVVQSADKSGLVDGCYGHVNQPGLYFRRMIFSHLLDSTRLLFIVHTANSDGLYSEYYSWRLLPFMRS